MKAYVDGKYLELTEELKQQLGTIDVEDTDETAVTPDTATALAEGLAEAQTLAQVRSAAKSVLGGET